MAPEDVVVSDAVELAPQNFASSMFSTLHYLMKSSQFHSSEDKEPVDWSEKPRYRLVKGDFVHYFAKYP